MHSSSKSSSLFWGGLLIVMGILMLSKNLNLFDLIGYFFRNWPILLILLGVYLIWETKKRDTVYRGPMTSGFSSQDGGQGSMMQSNVLGDVRIKFDQVVFNGGEAKTVLGSVVIDASEIKLAPGEQQLFLHCTVGDINVDLAPDVPVQISTQVSLGDIKVFDRKADGFSQEINFKTPDYDAAPARLHLICRVGLGDIKIY
jgi:predicted membrane protein